MTKTELRLGFIGAGNMAEAFVGAIVASGGWNTANIFVSDINQQRLEIFKHQFDITVTSDNCFIFDHCDMIFLSVKPQMLEDVLIKIVQTHQNKPLTQRKRIISIAAGITLSKIETWLYSSFDKASRQNLPIIRVMPNTPALVLSGMSGICANAYASKEDLELSISLLETVGKVIAVQEKEMDAVTALSGSGPAYVFFLAESMIEAGIKAGLTPEDAMEMTTETIMGAAKLMLHTKEAPEILRQKVTSPGGTTEAAFNVFSRYNTKDIIIEAIQRASDRSKELSQ